VSDAPEAAPAPGLWTLAAVFGATAVILGAFGAHALEDLLDPDRLHTWGIGTRYHLVHSAALLAAALHPARLVWGPRLLIAGILLFSGSLYAIALTGISTFGLLTPFGGLFLIGGWFALAAGR
jgi:uncharacterized membrane protein YgdD (TMEM256/DUF423 family)